MPDESFAEKTPDQVKFVQAVEQYSAWLRDFAPLVGAYYKALKAEGIPDTVCASLLIETQRLIVPSRST